MSHRTVSQREKGRKWKKLTENCYMVGRLAKAVLSSSGVRITQNEKKKRKSSCLCLVRARRKFKEHIKNHLFQILEAICLFLRNSSRWKRPCAWQQWVGKQTTYRFCSCENIYRQRMTVFAIIFFFLAFMWFVYTFYDNELSIVLATMLSIFLETKRGKNWNARDRIEL